MLLAVIKEDIGDIIGGLKMKCPKCEGKTKVIDTVHGSSNEVYRRRKCLECDHRFYTQESEAVNNAAFKSEYWECHRNNRLYKQGENR